MINYSVYMQANPVDETAAPKAYARAQVKEVMTFQKFIEHIAEHGGHNRGQVKGVLSDTCKCLVEQLLEGKKIMLEELGSFWLTLNSEGAETIKAFTENNIKAVNILFTPGTDFENLLSRAEFNQVASRAAQAATLKAEKAGETTVDLAAAKAGNSSASDSSSSSGTDDTGTSGGNSSGSEGGGDDSNPL